MSSCRDARFSLRGKRGQVQFVGTARRVLRTNWTSPLFPKTKQAYLACGALLLLLAAWSDGAGPGENALFRRDQRRGALRCGRRLHRPFGRRGAKVNAEAVALEIQNSVDYVKAYYERKHIYEEEYRRKHPDKWAVEAKRQERIKKWVTEQYQSISASGDRTKTDVLNWLLGELSNSTSSLQYVRDAKSPLQPHADLELSDAELRQIRLTDGGHAGSRLLFSAGDGAVLLPKWPPALRGDHCKAARDNFDRARDAIVNDLKAKRQTGPESEAGLIEAIEGLSTALDAAYPSEVRVKHREYSEYWKAQCFIKALLAAADRAIAINDPSVFSGELRFDGKSLFLLLQHMHRHGLQFAEPGPGAEGLYQTLFVNLRDMYAELAREQPAAKGQPDNGGEKQ